MKLTNTFLAQLALLLVVAIFSVPAVDAGGQTRATGIPRALFIGNSLTAANDLPGMVQALSSAAGGPTIECEVVAFPDHSLEDHWKRGRALEAIAQGRWTTVILQQGPSALPESRTLLIEYARKFDERIRRAGARTALYMVWPSAARRGDFDGVKRSYQEAARTVDGLFLPVGEAWRLAWRHDPNLPLYGPDGFHPTREATYLAALVIHQSLSGRSPAGLPSTLTLPGGDRASVTIAPATAAVLQRAAAEAHAGS